MNLSEYAVKLIGEYLKRGRAEPALPIYQDYLILSLRGKPLSRDSIWVITQKIAFKAGIEKNVYPHLFRHSMATHMAEKGLPAPLIQAQTGHKSLDDVQKYIHLSQKSVRDAYDSTITLDPDKETDNKQNALESKEKASETRNSSEKCYSAGETDISYSINWI